MRESVHLSTINCPISLADSITVIKKKRKSRALPVEISFRRPVQKGILWLDDTYPGWVDRINTSILDMDSCTACILGQLTEYDPYVDAPDVLPNGYEWSMAHGFCASVVHRTSFWVELTKTWIEAIERRRKTKK